MKDPDGRRASGLIVLLAVACAAIVFLVFFHQSRLTSWTSAGVDGLERGDRAEAAAEAYIQEAMAGLRNMASDRHSPLFEILRAPLQPGSAMEAVDITRYLPCRQADLLMGRDDFQGYELLSREVVLALRRPLDLTPCEYIAFTRFRAAVRAPRRLSGAVTRRVEELLPYKLVITSMPRPFCAYGLFVGDVSSVMDCRAVNECRARLVSLLEKIWTRADALGCDEELSAEVCTVDRAAGALPLPDGEACLYGLLWEGLEHDLPGLVLDRVLAAFESAALAAFDRSAASSGAASVEALVEAGRTVTEALWHLWAFSKAFKVLPPSEDGYAAVEKAGAVFSSAYWHRRVTHSVAPGDFKRFTGLYPSFEGVLLVRNEQGPLLLEGRLRGRCTIVTGRGGVSLRDFNKDEEEGDRVLVVSLGGPVSIEGESHAAIVLADGPGGPVPSLRFSAGAVLHGALACWRMPPSSCTAGLIHRIEKYSSGYMSPSGTRILAPDHLAVIFGVAPRYRRVERR